MSDTTNWLLSSPLREINGNDTVLKDQKIFHILDHIYLGTCWGCEDKELLEKNKIKHILNCAFPKEPNHFEADEKKPFEYTGFHLLDHVGLGQLELFIDKSNTLISECESSKRNILVHCSGGLSRSVSLIICFLMKHRDMSLIQAFDLIESKRGRPPLPNPSFWTSLAKYERKIFNRPLDTYPSVNYSSWVIEDFKAMGFNEEEVKSGLIKTFGDADAVFEALLDNSTAYSAENTISRGLAAGQNTREEAETTF